jgi:hypothetical protein
MLIHAALLSLLASASPRLVAAPSSYRPRVEVWTNRGDDPYTAGQAVQVFFQTDQDAYVTVLRVDTDGNVRVLFPLEPWEDNFSRGGRTHEIPAGLRADDYPGEGYLFAVAAADPFTYYPIESNQRWSYELIADGGRIRGDPYAALTELAARIVPDGSDWDYDIAPYYVQQHYEYPRFLCYDCHTYVSFRAWNPYDYSCVRFRIVAYDDPSFYPYRSYGGTRVVFRRPYRPEPRFIFKDRIGSEAFFTRVRERPVNDTRRREVGVRGRDIGSPGTVPPPNAIVPHEQPRFPGQREVDDRGVSRDRQAPPDPRVFPDHPIRPPNPEHPTPREGQDHSDRGRPSLPAPPKRPETSGTGTPQTRRGPTTEPARPRQAPPAEPARGQHETGKPGEPQLRRRKP